MSSTDERGDGSVGITQTAPALPADGDDIVVIPGGPDEPRGPQLWTLIGAALVSIGVIIAGGALLTRHDGKTTQVQVQSPAPTAPPVAPRQLPPKKPVAKHPLPSPTFPAPYVPASGPNTPVSTPSAELPKSTPQPGATVPLPKQYGASVLTWDAPHALNVAAGGTASLAVTAHNPTNGIVNLPHPLSCAPRLDHSEVCTEMLQTIPAGGSASASYTIDAHGIAPGTYTLKVEGVLTVRVTVS